MSHTGPLRSFSVTIPTMNRPQTLQQLLDRLRPQVQSAQAEGLIGEVLVCNDGEPIHFEEPDPAVRILTGPHRGPAANRNVGLRTATGDLLILIDDDCIPTPGWLKAFIDSANNEGGAHIDVFEGRTVADRPRTRLDEMSPTNETGGYFWTCNLAVRSTLLQGVGYMDDRFRFADLEDVEWAARFTKAGSRTTFVHTAVAVHPYRRRRPLRELRSHSSSVPILISAHPELRTGFTRSAYMLMALRDARSLTTNIVRFRGRGLPRALLKTACYCYLAVRPPRKKTSS